MKISDSIKKTAAKVAAVFDLQDVFAFGGVACVAYGTAQIYPPAAWIVSGAALFWLAVRK